MKRDKFPMDELLLAAGAISNRKYRLRVMDRTRNMCIGDDTLISFHELSNAIFNAYDWLKLDDIYVRDIILGHNDDIYIIAR